MSHNWKSHSRGRVFSDRALVIVGLTIFIAVDIVLVALALGQVRDEPHTAGLAPPTQPPSPVEDVEETTDDAEPSSEAPVLLAPRLLSVVGDTVAWRSEGGACDERGALELTFDGGESWGSTYPSYDGLGRPLWMLGDDYGSVRSVIASGGDCDPEGTRTVDSGASWTQDDEVVASSVLVYPNDPSVLLWGGRAIEGPCEVMTQVAVTGGVASVVCDDGSLWSVPSNNAEWTQAGVDRAVAVSGSEGRWVAAVESADCGGLSLVEFDDASVESLACAPAESGDAAALDISGNTLWLWTGDQILVSTNLGRSLN